MNIVKYPNPILNEVCEKVNAFDSTLACLLNNMVTTMLENDGIGLAANQVGINARMFVMIEYMKSGTFSLPLDIINPEIVESDGIAYLKEGCLSAPGTYMIIASRANHIRLRYQNRFGRFMEKDFYGINAVCVQHEMDHLDGIFFLEKWKKDDD